MTDMNRLVDQSKMQLTRPTGTRTLRMVRLPGELGPVLRCSGELSVATAEALRRELALLAPLGHPAIILNLSGCCFLDLEGVVTILQTFKRLREDGRRLALVAGTERTRQLLQILGLADLLPMFPTEELANRALRSGEPPPRAPESWAAARRDTLARWRKLEQLLDRLPPEQVLRELTSQFPLCQRAERAFQEHPTATAARCQLCPLFYAAGAGADDVGCHRLLAPLLEAIQGGDPASARARIAEITQLLEEMPLPIEGPPAES